MKIRFLTPFGNQLSNPTFRYRVENVIEGLQERGWNTDLLLNISDPYDVGIIQSYCSLLTSLKMRRNSRFLVYDINDNLFFVENDHRHSRFLAQISDLVICSSQYLMERYRPLNKNCFWIPDLIDFDCEPGGGKERITMGEEKIVIVWMGYRNNLPYLEEVNSSLLSLSKKYDIVVKVITSEESDLGFSNREKLEEILPEVKTHFVTWSFENFICELAQSDIAIAPLFNNEFCKSKSENKLISYMIMGLPVVASPIPAYRNIIKDGYNGFLAASPEEWKEKLERLIGSEDLRRFIGVNGKKVTHYFRKENVISIWESVLVRVQQELS